MSPDARRSLAHVSRPDRSTPLAAARSLPSVAILASCVAVFLVTPSADASLVLPMDFLALHQRAGSIFHGRCVEKREVADAQPLPYTEYTFEVIDAAKGVAESSSSAPRRVTIRHVGTSTARPRADGLEEAPLRWGMPRYEVGQEWVLFLTRESKLGLCSPVGLTQGAFQVVREHGKALVKNPRGAALFSGVDSRRFRGLAATESRLLASPAKELELGCFIGLCKKASSE